MKGETSVDERVVERLRKIEEIRKFFSRWYRSLDPTTPNSVEWASDLIAAMTEYAAWLALYEGIDYDTLAERVVKETRFYFPDIIG